MLTLSTYVQVKRHRFAMALNERAVAPLVSPVAHATAPNTRLVPFPDSTKVHRVPAPTARSLNVSVRTAIVQPKKV